MCSGYLRNAKANGLVRNEGLVFSILLGLGRGNVVLGKDHGFRSHAVNPRSTITVQPYDSRQITSNQSLSFLVHKMRIIIKTSRD